MNPTPDLKRIARNVRKALRAARVVQGRSVDRIIVRGRVVVVERLGASAPAKGSKAGGTKDA